jgi:hypothetical protein
MQTGGRSDTRLLSGLKGIGTTPTCIPPRAGARDTQHLRRHGKRLAIARLTRKRAIAPTVAAQTGERFTNLAGIGNYRAGARIANAAGFREKMEQLAPVASISRHASAREIPV